MSAAASNRWHHSGACPDCGVQTWRRRRDGPAYCRQHAPNKGQFERIDPTERFWEKVERHNDGCSCCDGCWLWTASHTRGYGRFWDGQREWKAPRFSYELHIGPIPDGLWVLHSCDNPACVNPAHLFLGTNDDNMADKKAKGRNATGDRNGSRTHPERRPRGDRHPAAALSDEIARNLRDRYHDGAVRQVDLAVEFGVSQQTVSQVIRGEGRFACL